MAQKILITSALPYANGSIHLGHMLEYVQTDVYVRFLRSAGVDVVYFCADDTHGTPIELNAAKQGIPPDVFVAKYFEEHQRDIAGFDVRFDCYGSTNSEENRKYAELIYGRLVEAGDIDRREVEQTYCEQDKRFLPDRFVRGTCPNCKSADQYGDVCEKCGKTYSPTDLIDPKCSLCGSTPVRKKSAHLFFRLSRHAEELRALIRKPEFVNAGVGQQLEQFFEKGLTDWDISRDGPYFGFPIPGEKDKYFYVWLDAPIGYIATTEKWARETGVAPDALAYWGEKSNARIVHVIGKDIVYFHALFWPAVLKVAGLKQPSKLIVHGHLTVNGEKMSKTRGTLIAARTYLDKLDPSYLRYFYAANLGPGPEDMDLSLRDFRLRVNGELVNNIGNLANRALSMLAGSFEKSLAAPGGGAGRALVEQALARVPEIRACYERLEFRAAVKAIVELGQAANQFLQAQAPWAKAKMDREAAHRDLSDAAEVAYLLAGLLAPVVPRISEKLFSQLGAPPLTFAALEAAQYPLLNRTLKLGDPSPLIARLEEGSTEVLVAGTPAVHPPAEKTVKEKTESPRDEIEYADFERVVLKVGQIVTAERIDKSDKLLKLSVNVGEPVPRTIAAGIAEAYAPDQLVGRKVVVVANLKSKKLRGIESHGMLLAAGPGGKELSLVDPGSRAPGDEVK